MDKTSSGHLVSSWLIPLVFSFVLAFVIAVVFMEFNSASGPEIRVTFDSGHGLQPDDDIKCRGITIGTVRSLELDGDGVLAVLQLDPEASTRIARAQTRWWIARPKVGLSRVQGIDSLLGPRWIQVDPAPSETDPCFEFKGLDEPPIVDSIGSRDLLLFLQASDRGTLHQGSSVLYRGVSIGTVLDARLADDSTSVVAEVLIQARFVALVRDNSRFYQTGAFDLDIGFDGINARLDSLETLIVGGVSLVTPDAPGDTVESGHSFQVLKEPESAWLRWRPKIMLDG
jgi:paraquat-inducible protein B